MSAISDTGPLISIFQSDSLATVSQLVEQIYITPTCVAELQKHGYREALADAGSSIIIRTLTEAEGLQAFIFAQQIASDLLSKDPEPRNHLGKGEIDMVANMQSIHEPEAELSTLEEALEDAEVVRGYLERKRRMQSEQSIALSVPLQVMIEAIDQMEEPALQQVAQHVERRLALIALPLWFL